MRKVAEVSAVRERGEKVMDLVIAFVAGSIFGAIGLVVICCVLVNNERYVHNKKHNKNITKTRVLTKTGCNDVD